MREALTRASSLLGLVWFLVLRMVSIVVMAAAWIAARPLLVAPIASVFGKTSSR